MLEYLLIVVLLVTVTMMLNHGKSLPKRLACRQATKHYEQYRRHRRRGCHLEVLTGCQSPLRVNLA